MIGKEALGLERGLVEERGSRFPYLYLNNYLVFEIKFLKKINSI